MKSVLILDQCLLSKDVNGVLSFINSFDPAAANDKMRSFTTHFELETVEIGGILYAHLGRTAQILGYSDVSGLWKLLDTYQIQTPKIGWFGDEVKTRIRETFKLNPKDSQASMVDWKGVLVAGMAGRTPGAEKIRLYLYSMEIAGSAAMDEKDDLAAQKLLIQKCTAIGNLCSQYEKANNPGVASVILEQIERLNGKPVQDPRQKKLSLVPTDN